MMALIHRCRDSVGDPQPGCRWPCLLRDEKDLSCWSTMRVPTKKMSLPYVHIGTYTSHLYLCLHTNFDCLHEAQSRWFVIGQAILWRDPYQNRYQDTEVYRQTSKNRRKRANQVGQSEISNWSLLVRCESRGNNYYEVTKRKRKDANNEIKTTNTYLWEILDQPWSTLIYVDFWFEFTFCQRGGILPI